MLIVSQLPIDFITAVEEKLPPALNQRAQVNRVKGKGNQGISPLASLYGSFSDPQMSETDVTAEDINNSIASGEPLNINTRKIYIGEVAGGDPAIVSGELLNDLSLGFKTTPLKDSALQMNTCRAQTMCTRSPIPNNIAMGTLW